MLGLDLEMELESGTGLEEIPGSRGLETRPSFMISFRSLGLVTLKNVFDVDKFWSLETSLPFVPFVADENPQTEGDGVGDEKR